MTRSPAPDSRGRCSRHSFVQLRRLSARTGEWMTLLDACPLCKHDIADVVDGDGDSDAGGGEASVESDDDRGGGYASGVMAHSAPRHVPQHHNRRGRDEFGNSGMSSSGSLAGGSVAGSVARPPSPALEN